MTKGQTIGWSIGVGVFLLIVVVLIVMNKDKISGAIGGIVANQPISPTYPAYCDKERFGYDIYGNANSNCGVIASEPYSANCDPDRPGYDLNGFANPDCGFGRTQKPKTEKIDKGGIYDSNGNPINVGNQKQMSCKDMCNEVGAVGWSLEQYPKGSSSYPYYYCSCSFKTT